MIPPTNKLEVKTNWTSLLCRNRYGHHNTVLGRDASQASG